MAGSRMPATFFAVTIKEANHDSGISMRRMWRVERNQRRFFRWNATAVCRGLPGMLQAQRPASELGHVGRRVYDQRRVGI